MTMTTTTTMMVMMMMMMIMIIIIVALIIIMIMTMTMIMIMMMMMMMMVIIMFREYAVYQAHTYAACYTGCHLTSNVNLVCKWEYYLSHLIFNYFVVERILIQVRNGNNVVQFGVARINLIWHLTGCEWMLQRTSFAGRCLLTNFEKKFLICTKIPQYTYELLSDWIHPQSWNVKKVIYIRK